MLERDGIRNVLRVLVLWSRQKIIDGKDISVSYGRGILDVI
jgi:hypothetical protein